MVIEKKRKRPETSTISAPTRTEDAPKRSLLRADEAFPRGGGSVLTPMEYKEAINEGKRDALFEEPADKSTKRTKRHKALASDAVRSVREGAKIEGLSYKRLSKGTIILGQIIAINALDLVVALPNSLSGYVSITNVSPELSTRLESHEDSEGDDEESVSGDVPSLSELFVLGQWVRCVVISVSRGESSIKSGEKQKKRIDLSIEPEVVNQGLVAKDIQNRSLVQGSVISIEDHGLLLNLGIGGCKGFVKSKEYGQYVNEKIRPGQVILCSVTAAEGDKRVIQLSADLEKDPRRLKLKSITTIEAVLPGDGVEVVIGDAHKSSFNGKILGLLDCTCDAFQAGTFSSADDVDYKAGQKVLARVLFTDPQSEPRKVAVTLLPHILEFTTKSSSLAAKQNPLDAIPVGFVLDQVTVRHVETNVGLFCDVGIEGILGFVHISRISEGKVESLSVSTGKFKVGSQHRARVVGYSALDGVYLLSMEQKIIDTKYLSVNDLQVGEQVKGTVERFVKGGILVKLSEGMTGLVPEVHISDIKLQFPEKKFKNNAAVTCRILDTDAVRKRVILTMKKSLVNSEEPIIQSFDVEIGLKSSGIISKLFDNGALVQFYGGIHAFLPSSEMSEAYIANPKEHFRIGQVLSVRVIKVDAKAEKMTVSCKDASAWNEDKSDMFSAVPYGEISAATVTEKTSDRLVLSLQPSGLVAILEIGHMSDGDFAKSDKKFQKVRIGSHIKELVVIDKNQSQKHIITSMKPSLINAAKEKTILSSFETLATGMKLVGFVRKATDYGVLVGFAGGLTGLALKHNLSDRHISMPSSEFFALQSVFCTVIEVNREHQRFQVSLKDDGGSKIESKSESTKLLNPVDSAIDSTADFTPGRVLFAKIISIKETQLNLELAEGIQGRVDVSSIFESFEAVENKRKPLKHYEAGQQIKVKIVGIHDSRNHKFLPFSHRQSNANPVYECILRQSEVESDGATTIGFQDIKEGELYTAFVNNFAGDCLWVNISPIVRGRINLLDLETDATSPTDIQQRYSLGSAICCRVLRFVPSTKHLDLSERAVSAEALTTLQSVKVGSTVPAKITRVAESGLLAQLTDSISGKIALTDISSDFTENPTSAFSKNSLVQVIVKSVDIPNKKIALSLRTSTSKVVDPEINTAKDLTIGSHYRGYIKNVADQGLFVELGRDVTARVKIAEVSDAFVKDWKKGFSVDQLVSGTVISIDPKTSRVEMSLKKSPKIRVQQSGLSDLSVGQVVEATVKNIQEFGVFIQVNSVCNASGLCHKSEVADKPVKDLKAIYNVGDLVKAKILAIDVEKRRISFGLKASYFNSAEELDEEDIVMEEQESPEASELSDDEDEDEVVSEMDEMSEDESEEEGQTLAVDDFDWTGNSVFDKIEERAAVSQEDEPKKDKKKKRKAYDDSAVASKEPESVADFERLVLGQPDSSLVWINYMAFYMQLADYEAARGVADRALKTIHYRQESEKLNVWMALLNLENNFGSPETLDAVFRRSLETNEPQDMYSRLVGTLIRSEKFQQAGEIYETMVKKFHSSLKIWVEYANFLATQNDLEAARVLLPRSLQSLPKSEHIALMTKFGILEFKRGDAERGRTLFEGLLSQFPKRLDLWNVLIDMEAQQPSSEATVRELFQRILAAGNLSMKKAKSVFKKWLQYEKEKGTEDDVERVKAKAVEYVENH